MFSQEKNEHVLDLDQIIQKKEQDFNTVFVPLYNQRDTLKYNELYAKSKGNNYVLGEIIALNLLGTYYRDQAMYKKSIGLHEKALQISKKNQISDGILYSNNMLGVVFRRMDNVQKGLNYHFKALELAEKIEEESDFTTRNIAIAVNGIGNSYLILEEYKSARKQFRRSFAIEKSIDNRLGLAINHQNIGFTYEKTNQLDSALYHYQASLEQNNYINSDVGKMICFNSISNVYLTKNKFQEALEYINKAEKIAVQIGDNFYTATNYLIKAQTLMKLNKNEKAKHYLDKSLKISKKHGLKTNLADTYESFSDYYAAQKNFEKALDCSNKSKEVTYAYLNENNLKTKNNLEISYDVEQKTSEILNLKKEKDAIALSASRREKLIIALAALLLAITLLAILFRQREKLIKEKQMLELEQKVLRAQMNPHFTFNALNSIKAYIISEETEKAVKYLNKFAKLIRGVLYSSDKKTISLKDELDTIESYVTIEDLRIHGNILMNIQIDDVNPNLIEIPPLVLQPYVENALWHGLAKKEGEKKLTIHVYKNKKKNVSVDIIDNGIGRVASAKKTKNPKHKSMGIAISRKRLENFFQLKSQECDIEYTDLKTESGEAAGTKVSLCIPCSENCDC